MTDARISKKALQLLVDEAVDTLSCNEDLLGEDELLPMREAIAVAKKALEAIEPGRRFPIQRGLTITWEATERAYKNYARKFGDDQSLARLAERGGFGVSEYAWLWNGARDDEKGNLASGLRVREDTIARALVDGDVRVK